MVQKAVIDAQYGALVLLARQVPAVREAVSGLSQMENCGALRSLSWIMLKKGASTPWAEMAEKPRPCATCMSR